LVDRSPGCLQERHLDPAMYSGRDGTAAHRVFRPDFLALVSLGRIADGGGVVLDTPIDPVAVELAAERAYVDGLYDRLDTQRAQNREALRATRLSRAGGNPQAQSERDAFAAQYERRLAQLEAVDDGLCFGRLDRSIDGVAGAEPERLYIGRLGLSTETQQTLLVDWRAPIAAAFYRATAAHPQGVVRRRHLRTRGRAVEGFDDEVFDLEGLSAEDRTKLSGEAALMAVLQENRTGRMRDVVATLQAEQDEVVRADREGVLVVQGGPGTGKTVVALHRAAYLLYTYREHLASAGVLVVGPGDVFLRYVEQVLPSLGETAVVLATIAELFPGIRATGVESDEVATVKGDRRMVEVMRAAVRDRQQLPDGDLTFDHYGKGLRLDRRTCAAGRDHARRSNRPHNLARNVFVRHVLSALGRQLSGKDMWDSYDRRDRDEVLLELVRNRQIRGALDAMWPHLTAPVLLADLYANRRSLAATGLPADVCRLLERDPDEPWTPADVPLLDEAAELLGETNPWLRHAQRRAEAEGRAAVRYAEDTLRSTGAGGGLVDAATLAGRYTGRDRGFDGPSRALSDRSWVFGHVVVDEAQELSWMSWRLLMRRCPSRSMTVVGDVAQAGAPWAARSWSTALRDHAPQKWRTVELTVGYRTPAPVMDLAADVLATIDPSLTPPRAVRTGTPAPQALSVNDLGSGTVDAVRTLRAQPGRIGVLVPADLLAGIRAALVAAFGGDVGDNTDARVAVLTVAQSKGLEFDAVVVVEPAALIEGSSRGAGDLYVALTRTTDRLLVVHARPLPKVLQAIDSGEG
jgi:DNA helicase IV